MNNLPYGYISIIEPRLLAQRSINDYLIESNKSHFEESQKISKTPPIASSSLLTTTQPCFKLVWIFFDEFLKIKPEEVSKLKATGFDFSKYFYLNAQLTRPENCNTSIILNISLSPSGGTGNMPDLMTALLVSKGLNWEEFNLLNNEAILEYFDAIEIEMLKENNILLLNQDLLILRDMQRQNPI